MVSVDRMQRITMQEIRDRELKLLIEFSKFCDKNNLIYVLAGGTLLGAIRHRGFIPWDDDIDVMMPRSDYNRLIALNNKTNELEIRTISNESSCIPFAKVIDAKTMTSNEYAGIDNADSLWIDIFPIDGLPCDWKKVKKIYRDIKFLRKCHGVTLSKFGTGTTKVKSIGKAILYVPLKIIGSFQFARWIDNYCQKIKFEESDYVGGISWGYGPQERMPKKEWLERVKVEFEGHEFWAPGCWDLYLRNLYGDYMKLPPEEKRITHNMVVYVKE